MCIYERKKKVEKRSEKESYTSKKGHVGVYVHVCVCVREYNEFKNGNVCVCMSEREKIKV